MTMKLHSLSFLRSTALLAPVIGVFAFALLAPTFADAKASNNSHGERVFVLFDKSVGEDEHALVRAFGGEIKNSYSIVNAVATRLPAEAIEGLSHNPHVLAIEPDLEVQAVDIELDNSWGVKRIGGGDVHATYANRGEGVRVGIIDSGINYEHPDLNDNYRGGYDFYYYDHDPMDVYGHGTHVAGTACAEDDNTDGTTSASPKLGVVGAAAGCDLYSLRVLNEDGVGYFSDIVASIEWSLGDEVYLPAWGNTPATTTRGIRMDVVNLSLGQNQDPGETVRQAFDEAYNRGLLIVAAAGNSGNPGGNGNSIIYPAKYESVIAVGATDSSDNRASFSSTGDQLELVVPGVSVYSAWNDNASYSSPQPVCTGTLSDINGDGEPDGECYKYGSGTSMASPHVAGTAALVMKAYRDAGIVFTNADVRALLNSTALDLGVTGRDSRYGYGLIRALTAVSSIVPPGPQAPVANAGADKTVSDSDGDGLVTVALNGSASYDPDGSIASYAWDVNGDMVIDHTGPTPSVVLSVSGSPHTITLTVTDNSGLTGADSVVATVNPNATPSADAGPAQTVTDVDGNGSENVMLDGTASTDPDGVISSYAWYEGLVLLSTSTTPTVNLFLGDHTLTLFVTDNGGATDSDTVLVSVTDATAVDFTLSTVGYKVKGLQKADLSWAGAGLTHIDVYRNGVLITTTENDGSYTDPINKNGNGTYVYQVCEATTTTCSNESTVTFN